MHFFPKKFASVVKTGVLAVFAAGLLVSCTKESFNAGDKPTNQITDKKTQEQIREAAQELPAIGIYNRTMDKVIVFDVSNPEAKNFSFVNPGSTGINFATSNGGQAVYFVESDNLVILSEPSDGFGSGGGTVVVGNTALNIDIAFCFAAGEEALGGGLFGGDDFGDVAGVIGFAGDFEALENGDFDEEDADPFDFFEGFAYYFVYTDELGNQSYEVIEFFEAQDGEEDNDDFAFAWVVSFQGNDGGVYLSNGGTLTVNGGSMSFNGTYFGLEGLLFFDEEGDDDDFNFVEVNGFGTMGCD